ncbi:MAG: Dabb family protein [Planctomycetaceae bacterium]
MSHAAPMIVHNVYFSLHDPSPANREKLIDDCRLLLSGHPGTIVFAVGGVVDSLARPVNDRDFDVALLVVFRSLADHDAYQKHPRHVEFGERNKASWKKVRVFDSEA